MANKAIIIGIDPSVRGTGLGIIECCGNTVNYVTCQTVKLGGKFTFADCLFYIRQEIQTLIKRHGVHLAGIEKPPYVHSVDVLRKLGSAYGVAIEACRELGVEVVDLQPSEIKQSVSLSGKSDKAEVQKAVKRILGIDFEIDSDSADALATALTLADKLDGTFIPGKDKE